MPAQSKYDMLEKVNASLDASKGFYVIDYRSLTVKEAQELRRSLREAGGVMSSSDANDAAGYTLYSGRSYNDAAGFVTCDENGTAQITFDEPGEWVIWADGGKGQTVDDFVSSAAIEWASISGAPVVKTIELPDATAMTAVAFLRPFSADQVPLRNDLPDLILHGFPGIVIQMAPVFRHGFQLPLQEQGPFNQVGIAPAADAPFDLFGVRRQDDIVQVRAVFLSQFPDPGQFFLNDVIDHHVQALPERPFRRGDDAVPVEPQDIFPQACIGGLPVHKEIPFVFRLHEPAVEVVAVDHIDGFMFLPDEVFRPDVGK